jgi:Grx4 family monothiol glutaredoxin
MSAWPTYPQVYVKGALLGGVDILAEMKESGELAAALPARDPTAASSVVHSAPAPKPAAAAETAAPAPFAGLTPELTERLQALVKRAPVLLFMKGSPAEPKCGFSERMVQLLKANGVLRFDTFDILSDASVREGLKLLFNWPTFPQLYVKGELVGGLDVVRQMVEEGGGEPLPTLLGIA